MQPTINQIKDLYPKLKFKAATQFSWSPETGEIIYLRGSKGQNADWSLLHETGHALLGHKNYRSDYELLLLEVAAWDKAKEIAAKMAIEIDEDHIQDCLDTYRDWLSKRSICPNCGTQSIQQGESVHYRCHNCHTTWQVTANRFCRAYRRTNYLPESPASA